MMNNTYALETSSNYRLGASYTDNSLLREKNKKTELSINTAAGYNILDVLPNINYSLNTNVSYTKYTNNTLSDTVFYSAIGNFNWEIIPVSLTWQISDNLSVREINQFKQPLPNNKQQVNIFSTGPSYIYTINPINRVLIDYRFTDIKYERKNLNVNVDNKRDIYKLAIEHKLSGSSVVSLNYDDTTVKYVDVKANNNFTGNALFLLYTSIKPTSLISLSAGVTKARLVATAKDYQSDFYSAQWDYQMNYSSTLSARYWKGLSEATNDIRLSNFLNSGVVNTANLNDTNIFSVERFFLIFSQNKANWRTSYSLYGIEQDYGDIKPNLITFGGNIFVDYNITRSLVLTSTLSQIARRTKTSIEQKTLDKSFTLGTRYYLSTNLQFITQYQKNNRSSNLSGRSYDENVISISLTYNNAPLVARPQ